MSGILKEINNVHDIIKFPQYLNKVINGQNSNMHVLTIWNAAFCGLFLLLCFLLSLNFSDKCKSSTSKEVVEHGNSTMWAGTKIWAVPVMGIGQGNGAGPQIWVVVSTLILDFLWQEQHGTAFKAAISGNQIQLGWQLLHVWMDNIDTFVRLHEGVASYVWKMPGRFVWAILISCSMLMWAFYIWGWMTRGKF